MITIQKSDKPELRSLLDNAKGSDNETVYRNGTVYNQIKDDFHGKCYLCEDDEATSIQIEHFNPHKGDKGKKYDWNNLFFSCGHCNNLKGDKFWPLLNCTDFNDAVWDSIEIRFTAFPKAKIEIVGHPSLGKEEKCKNTCKLLQRSLGGENTTPMKKDEAINLRKKMLRVHKNLAVGIVNGDTGAIKSLITDKAPFAGMQRWTLKNEYPHIFKELVVN